MKKPICNVATPLHGWFQSIIGVQRRWRFDTLCDAGDVGRHARTLRVVACVQLHLTAALTMLKFFVFVGTCGVT